MDVNIGSIGVGVDGVSGPRLNLRIESGSDSVVCSAEVLSYLLSEACLRNPNRDRLLDLKDVLELPVLPYPGVFFRGVSGGAFTGEEVCGKSRLDMSPLDMNAV